jgi:hypothetical protein
MSTRALVWRKLVVFVVSHAQISDLGLLATERLNPNRPVFLNGYHGPFVECALLRHELIARICTDSTATIRRSGRYDPP